jgi:integral membrane protein (TIGR01906 family)
MEKALLHKIIIVLLIVLSASTAVMIYVSNIKAVAFDHDLYRSEFEKHNIYARFDETADIDKESAFLIEYLKEGQGEIESEFYNQKEKTHLTEVRQLFRLASTILNTAVIISIISLFLLIITARQFLTYLNKKQSTRYIKKLISRLLITIGAIVDGIAVLFILMSLTFSSAFIKFHELFFRTDTWMLDPATDNLIRMFPEFFFFDLFMKILFLSIIFATILLAIGIIIKLGKPTLMERLKKK